MLMPILLAALTAQAAPPAPDVADRPCPGPESRLVPGCYQVRRRGTRRRTPRHHDRAGQLRLLAPGRRR